MAIDSNAAARFFNMTSPTRLVSMGGGGGVSINVEGDDELTRFQRLQTEVYNEYSTWMKLDDYYYQGAYGHDIMPKEWKDKGFSPTIPQTAYDAVETNSNHILTTPDVFVPPRPSTTHRVEEEELAGRKADALEYFWHNVAAAHGNPLRKAAKALVKDGRCVLKKTLRWERVNEDGLNFGNRGFMWDVKVVANDTIYEDPDSPEDPLYVYEAFRIRVGYAKRLFPEAKGDWQDTINDLDKVRYVEMWTKPHGSDRGSRKIWIDDEVVLDKDNPYAWVVGVDDNGDEMWDGYLPYTIRASGWGDQDSEANPADLYVGVIRRMHSMLDTEARQLTAADVQLRISTFPPIKRWGVDPKENNFEFGPAAIWDFEADKSKHDVEAFQMPPLDPSSWTLMNRVHSSLNDISKAGTLGGSVQRGVDTATEADLNVRNASSKLTGPVDGLRSCIVEMSKQFFQDIENILESDVTVYGAGLSGSGAVTLAPEDISGFYEVFVELKTTDQASLDRSNMRLWADLKNEFALDQAFAMRKAGIKNPTARILARAEEDTFLSPEMGLVRLLLALAGSGKDGEFVRQTMRMAMAQGQQVNRNGGFQPGQADQTGAAGAGAIADVFDNANSRAQVEQRDRIAGS